MIAVAVKVTVSPTQMVFATALETMVSFAGIVGLTTAKPVATVLVVALVEVSVIFPPSPLNAPDDNLT